IVLSGDTTKAVLDDGVSSCVQDACIPVKLYHGHVMSLINRCDKIFVPRYTSIEKREFTCPKIIGLPEMLKGSGIIDDDKMLVIEIDAYKKPNKRHNEFFEYAMKILKDRNKARKLIEKCELSQKG